jgi:hypothetical protein
VVVVVSCTCVFLQAVLVFLEVDMTADKIALILPPSLPLSVNTTRTPLVQLIHILARFKYGGTRWLIAHVNMGVAWVFNMVVSCGLVAAASAAVVGGAPAAVGSGIPEVMAYLNGCMVSKASPLGYCFFLFPPHDSCSGSASDGTPLDVIDEHAIHACANMHKHTHTHNPDTLETAQVGPGQ